MKKFLLLLAASVMFLSSCKKDQLEYADLDVNGYGPLMFVSGDAISIYGSGFDPNPDNNKVLFEGVAGEVATATANRLQVIAPLLANSGKITVISHGKTVISNLPYTLLNLLSTTSSTTILSADKKYLIRGNVTINGKLIIQAGTVIFGEKATHGTLTLQDIDFEGTPDRPIVFTSDQPAGNRQPGDWGGIRVGQYSNTVKPGYLPNGIMKYVRVEFSSGLSLNMDPDNLYQNIQVSYSLAGGFSFSAPTNRNNGDALANNLVAFACQGTDFYFDGPNLNVQYALGLKDPYAANGSGMGIGMGQVTNCRLSNFTLVGYNPIARNILNGTAGFPVNPNAGRGVQVGSYYWKNGFQYVQNSEQFAMYNSVIAGSWLAGISMYGQGYYYGAPWDDYEGNANNGSAYLVSLQNNYVTGTAPAALPFSGGAFAREKYTDPVGGFENTQGDPKLSLFASANDTTKVLDFSLNKDDLGIGGLADYRNLNHPVLLPAAGSVLRTSAKFPPNSPLDVPLFNKDIKFVGAFGTQDWTAQWCNFNPQATKY